MWLSFFCWPGMSPSDLFQRRLPLHPSWVDKLYQREGKVAQSKTGRASSPPSGLALAALGETQLEWKRSPDMCLPDISVEISFLLSIKEVQIYKLYMGELIAFYLSYKVCNFMWGEDIENFLSITNCSPGIGTCLIGRFNILLCSFTRSFYQDFKSDPDWFAVE